MNTPFTPDRLRTLFQNQFNPTEWLTCLQQLFLADELRVKPEPLDTAEDQGYYWGAINTPDHYHIGLFHYVITRGSVVNRRVGLRKLVEQFTNKRWGDFDAALVVFSSRDHWRLSLICDIDGEATSPKRFTYVFGSRDLLYRTPIERFTKLQKEGITFAKMREAFSVEALSDEFFERYREQYADFVQYVTGKRYVKSGSKWEERVLGPAHTELISAFRFDEKRVRDYIKKMMGRITFLHFLQRKGWMCGDLNYMQHLFERSPYQDDYLDAVLEPLFFGILNTRPEEREALFTAKGWNRSLLSEWKSIPYLNGGLFECEAEDLTACRFPVDYFRRLFQFFSEYNFTIDENDPTDAEVGVDPEMLGKIFENLLEDNKDKGAFYTPKEIVRYMCRESLIAYLVTQSMERGNSNPREKVEASIRDLLNKPEEIVPRMNERQKREFGESLYRLKICDPAIGSGAFPMGLLNELVRLRALIDAWAKDENDQLLVGDYAALKSEIICNNIYGVDIERGAIDIARLRFWLSIVVDEVTPHTLPNLDYKFMQGNSLITTFNGEYINLDSKQNHANIVKMRMEKKRLYQLKQQYYTATGEQKHQLNVDIKDSILSLIALQLDFEYRQWFDHHNTMHYLPGMGIPEQLSFADIKQNLPADKQRMCDMGSSLRRQLHDETKPLSERAKLDIRFFDWRMMFTEVFEGPNPGFDIVIGNPPYGANIDDLIPLYERIFPNTSHGFKDIYKYFYDFGFTICKKEGTICFITPNTFLRQPRYGDLRRVLLKSDIVQILDLGENIFIDAVVPVAISLCRSSETKDNASLFVDLTKVININNAKEILSEIAFLRIKQSLWHNTINNVFVEKIRERNVNEDILDNILEMKDGGFKYQRFNVGLSSKGQNDLAERIFYKSISNKKEDERDIPILIGKEISSFCHSISPNKILRFDYKCRLKDNETTYYNKLIMDEPKKLIWRQTAPFFIGTVLSQNIFFGNTIQAGILKGKYREAISYEYLCGLLNSKYLRDIYEQNVKEGGRVFPQVKLEKLKPLPIVIPSPEQRKEVEEIVNRIITLKSKSINTDDLEEKLNQIVENLYK